MLRIIAGKHKHRIVPTIKNATYRPSTSKFREAIFNILSSGEFQDIKILHNNTAVLDLFAGTGSLAFEALSRGVGSATLIDLDSSHLKVAKEFATKINELANTHFLQMDATNLPNSYKKYQLVFIDPPYHDKLIAKSLKSLLRGNWLEDNAIIILELAKTDDLFIDMQMSVILQRLYNNNKLIILRYKKAIS